MKTKVSLDFGDSDNLSTWVEAVDQTLLDLFYSTLLSIRESGKGSGSTSENQYEALVKALKSDINLSGSLCRSQKYIQHAKNSSFDLFKVDGRPNKEKRNELKVWCVNNARKFSKTIADNSTIFKSSILDKVISVASETGAKISNFGALFHKKFKKRKVVSEQCFLRVPCKEKPYILAYNVCLVSQYQCERVFFVEKNKGQVELIMEMNQFKLKEDIVKNISEHQVKRLIHDMTKEGFFSF